MYTEFRNPLPVDTFRGLGTAIAVINLEAEQPLLWVVVIAETGEIWELSTAYIHVLRPPETIETQTLATAMLD